MIEIKVEKDSKKNVLKALEILALTPKKRKRALDNVGRLIIRESRKNARKQQTPEGRKWAKRQSKKRKRMQVGIARFIGITRNDSWTVTVGWKSKRTAQIARIHHEGIPQPCTRAAAIKEMNRA